MVFSLDDFNKEQLGAIRCGENTICVYAGPGTGKTKALVGRYAYLVQEMHVDPANILCLTFTRKAAEEMSIKISDACGDNRSKYIGTIHGTGNKVLRQDIYHLGFPHNFNILDDEMMDTVIFDIFNSLKIDWKGRGVTIQDCKTYFSEKKGSLKGEYIARLLDRNYAMKVRNRTVECGDDVRYSVFEAYLAFQTINSYLDYNDLVHVTNYLFEKLSNIKNKWAKRFHYILVDEFQDLTNPEFVFINHLASCHHRIFGVGDPDQSIYSFRGSNPGIFYDFYRGAKGKFSFVKNYRSKQEIINLSHDMILSNEDRGDVDVELKCVNGSGEKPVLIHTKTRHDEMRFMSETIKNLVNKGAHYSDFAILFRTNQQALEVEEHFLIKKIPYTVYSKNAFFKANEIKTALAYIRFMIYKDDASFNLIVRKFNKYISNKTLAALKEKSRSENLTYWELLLRDRSNHYEYQGKFDSFIDFVEEMDKKPRTDDFAKWCIDLFDKSGLMDSVMESGDEDKASNMSQLVNMINHYEPDNPLSDTGEQFLGYVALLQDGDCQNEKDRVQMMTIHCSKGMQYKYVFVIDFNEGVMPSSKSEDKEGIQEERRIAYVGFTRAIERLYVLESECGDSHTKISTFSDSFKKDHYQAITYRSTDKTDERPAIKPGSFVKNIYYGKGFVQTVNYGDRTCTVKFVDYDFPKENVSFDNLINLIDKENQDFQVDAKTIAAAKAARKTPYEIGDVVLHGDYGVGMIVNMPGDGTLVIQFKYGRETCDADSDQLIKREDYLEFKGNKK